MNTHLAGGLVAMWIITATSAVFAATAPDLIEQGDRLTQTDEGVPDSYLRAVALYEQATILDPKDPRPQIGLARADLALGDGEGKDRLAWYVKGQRAAERALTLKEDSADAHFYFAANHGQVVNLLPFWKVSPAVVADLEQHLRRTLALDPHHARALHMMAALLEDTPGPLRLLLAGKKDEVESYLRRAVEADADRHAYIRWSYVEFLRDHGQAAQARSQAQALVAMTHPVDRRRWAETYRPAAEALLKSLAAP